MLFSRQFGRSNGPVYRRGGVIAVAPRKHDRLSVWSVRLDQGTLENESKALKRLNVREWKRCCPPRQADQEGTQRDEWRRQDGKTRKSWPQNS